MATSKTKTAKKKATNAKKTSATRKTKTKTKARTSRARSAPAPVTELLPFVEEDEVLGQIVQMLDADDQDHRRSAAVVLGALAIEDAGCLAALRRASCHPDDAILRSRAAEAIGALAPPTIVQDLMPLLKDPESSVRSTARQVLASGRGVTAEDVATMMTARDDRQRIGAIAVLGAMATEDAQVTILEQLDDDSPKILDAILDALQPIYEQMDEEEAGEAADDLIARIDELDLENPRRSRVMTELWAALGHEDAAEGLCRVAATPTDDSVRVQALETLRTVVRGRRQAAAVFAALLDLLEDGETPPALLRPLCDALAGIDLPMNVERRVRALLKSEATPVRRWAIRALGGLDSAPAARAVAELARTGDATDREISLEVVVHTSAGRNALARQLTKMTDGGRAEAAAAALKPHLSALPKSVVDALGEAAVEAPEEVGNVIIGLLSRGGIG
ncbi:MAG: HEAT repeat domain-containing protein, partial [Myxococcota bacterium]